LAFSSAVFTFSGCHILAESNDKRQQFLSLASFAIAPLGWVYMPHLSSFGASTHELHE